VGVEHVNVSTNQKLKKMGKEENFFKKGVGGS